MDKTFTIGIINNDIDLATTPITSRSAIECYQECNKRRFYEYIADGFGYVPTRKSIPLTTGISVHKGIATILGLARNKGVNIVEEEGAKWVEEGVEAALFDYDSLVKQYGFGGSGTNTDEGQRWTYHEQRALTEALVRAWYLRELIPLLTHYKIYSVEEELEELIDAVDEGEIILAGKADAILLDRENDDVYVYSLKTIKEFDWRAQKSYRSDLQGITETWLAEQMLERRAKALQQTIEAVGVLPSIRKRKALIETLCLSKIPNRCSGVKFCFLVKGNRVEEKDSEGKGTGIWRTYSPFIRGYRRVDPGGIKYAHSWRFPNSGNKSGYGTLGKGWEPFNVWEDIGVTGGKRKKGLGVKEWMRMLDNREVQEECGDVIKQQVITPDEYFRNAREIEEVMRETVAREAKVLYTEPNANNFDQNRRSCYYPSDCPFTSICIEGKELNDLVAHNELESRTPHHRLEVQKMDLLTRLKEQEGAEA